MNFFEGPADTTYKESMNLG